MVIDLERDRLLSLSEAAKVIPAVEGRKPHASTLWRWMRKGLKGIKLDFVRVGHRICTTPEAIARFMERLAEADADDVGPLAAASKSAPNAPTNTSSPKPRTTKQRERDIAAAQKVLDAAGI